jgi:hypothetical protein
LIFASLALNRCLLQASRLKSCIVKIVGCGLVMSSTFLLGPLVPKSNLREGSLEDFFREFHGTWSARWQRHAAIPESQWYDILAFARQFARPVPCQSIPLTPDILSNEIKRKKRGTARGLDGVSLQDLKHLPPNALDNMLDKPLHILPPC